MKLVVRRDFGIGSFFFAVIWMAGIVLANGFWSTLFSIICPPWGWYLCVYTALVHYGVV